VTPIRPLEPDDIPAVAGLYERVLRSGGGRAPVALEAFFRDEVLEQPWADPDIPSLVYESDGAILGVLASHVRRFLLDGRPLRIGYSGPLVADPDADKPGVGALLMRTHMRGAQEASATDGATSVVRAMWERLGGVMVPTASLGWTRVLRPARFGAVMAERRRGRAPRRLASVLDSLASPLTARTLRPERPAGSVEPLDTEAVLSLVERGSWRLRPDYDRAYLDWLFAQMAAVRARGELRRLLVRDEGGDPLGWAVYYLQRDGISQVQQIAAFGDPGPVLDHVLWDAFEGGSVAAAGRLEPPLVPAVSQRRCLLRRSEWALAESGDAEVLSAIAAGNSLVTRMDGEWWMAPHLIPAGGASA
jgi:predicted N-acetyltransferase YhbS